MRELTPLTMKPLTPKQLSDLILTFNNSAVTGVEGGWLNFQATSATARGIRQVTGRTVRGVGGVDYQILLSNNPLNYI